MRQTERDRERLDSLDLFLNLVGQCDHHKLLPGPNVQMFVRHLKLSIDSIFWINRQFLNSIIKKTTRFECVAETKTRIYFVTMFNVVLWVVHASRAHHLTTYNRVCAVTSNHKITFHFPLTEIIVFACWSTFSPFDLCRSLDLTLATWVRPCHSWAASVDGQSAVLRVHTVPHTTANAHWAFVDQPIEWPDGAHNHIQRYLSAIFISYLTLLTVRNCSERSISSVNQAALHRQSAFDHLNVQSE